MRPVSHFCGQKSTFNTPTKFSTDMVLIVNDPGEGRRVVQHADGTIITTMPDGNVRCGSLLYLEVISYFLCRVECAGYATVSINRFSGYVAATLKNKTKLTFERGEKAMHMLTMLQVCYE